MGWDIVLFNTSQKISSPEEVDENQLIPTGFCAVLESHFTQIKKNGDQRSAEGKDFTIEYFKHNEESGVQVLHLYGENALFEIVLLAKKYGWQIYDTGLGEFIDLDDPSKNGYENFQQYLRQVLNKKLS